MSTVERRGQRWITFAAAGLALHTAPVRSQETPIAEPAQFTVAEIQIDGLQRVSAGTVYSYLPVNIGDTLNAGRVREAIRALYATGFFREVELRRAGGTLVVVVLERPSIESFDITGNKDIKTDDLQKMLRQAGLTAGKTFDRSVLDEVTQYLTDMYFSRGKYGVRIDTDVEEVPGNKVKIAIDIAEGKRARIRQINVVGNTRFKDKALLDEFELKTPNWMSWYKQGDRYSRESLQGDLEKLRSYYMDRGYANFQVESTQVAIAPDKDDIFVTINIDEGDVFKVSEVKLAGNMVVPEAELKRLLLVRPGQTFSNKLVTSTQELLGYRLGADGYAFAKVDPVPTTNDETKEVALTFFIEPGSRVYVRHINFLGTDSINDETLRREMRQLEGSWLSNKMVELSKERLQRQPYIKKVETETQPVPGSPDMVDVNVTIEEGLPGQFGGGVGYSESQKFVLNGNFVHSNFRGRGERIAAEINSSKYSEVYSLSHTNPYITMDGISRTLNLSYTDVSQLTSSSSDFSTKTYLAGLDFSYPITERQTIRFASSLQHAELATVLSSSTQLQDWVENNGDSFFRLVGSTYVLGTRADIAELSAGWGYENRDRFILPTRGASQRFLLSSTVPGSPIEYFTATYQYEQYFRIPFIPLLNRAPLRFNTRASYAKALGDTTAVPPNRHFFTGGSDSVRGFRDGTLGPRDSLGNSFGGDAALSGQLEVILPMPAKFSSAARVAVFYDFGQSFYLGDTRFKDKIGSAVDYGFDLNDLRTSVGIGVQWLAPLGLFRFSFAFPVRYQRETWKHYGDEVERFQFSIGNAF